MSDKTGEEDAAEKDIDSSTYNISQLKRMRYKESEMSLNKFVPKGTEGLVMIEEAKESNNVLKPEVP